MVKKKKGFSKGVVRSSIILKQMKVWGCFPFCLSNRRFLEHSSPYRLEMLFIRATSLHGNLFDISAAVFKPLMSVAWTIFFPIDLLLQGCHSVQVMETWWKRGEVFRSNQWLQNFCALSRTFLSSAFPRVFSKHGYSLTRLIPECNASVFGRHR